MNKSQSSIFLSSLDDKVLNTMSAINKKDIEVEFDFSECHGPYCFC